jgi:hypothetical protein
MMAISSGFEKVRRRASAMAQMMQIMKVLCSGGRRERLKAVARGWRMVHGWVQR